MAHIQYPFEGPNNRQPAERLLYISKTSYNDDWGSIYHSHSYAELFYVTSGSGFFCTDSKYLPIQKDSLILINPNILHTEKSSRNEPLTYIVLGIDNLYFQFADSGSTSYFIYDFKPRKDTILPLMQMMFKEAQQRCPSSEEICQHYLNILLLLILRATGSQSMPYSSKDIPGECKFIKDYLDAHYSEAVSLEHLSKICHLNKYYLSHIFSKTYGISPINYLLERRILNSKQFLKNTDYSIGEIAHIIGFSSSNYFSQVFKKHTGSTAVAYRKQHKTQYQN